MARTRFCRFVRGFFSEWLGAGLEGDYNNNGELDAGDLDLQAVEIVANPGDPAFDLNNDGVVDFADRQVWVDDLKSTWIGDANLDMEFNSGDMVQVFVHGRFEDGVDLNSDWGRRRLGWGH